MPFRPMLAAKLVEKDLDKLPYPLLASAKLDGVRAIVSDGVVYSRSMKPLPNKRLQLRFGRPELNGFDGELIVGLPYDPDVYRNTVSEVMTIDGPCTADFYAFDRILKEPVGYLHRLAYVNHATFVHVLEQKYVNNADEARAFEEAVLTQGYEGIILRTPNGKYKQNRSTLREAYLLKLKRFVDGEARVVGMEQLMHNGNEAQVSEIGLTKRSTHQENQVPMGMMGALWCVDLKSRRLFKIGTGFKMEDRKYFWNELELTGKILTVDGDKIPEVAHHPMIIKYKSFKIGEKDKPRHPVYLGQRSRIDM